MKKLLLLSLLVFGLSFVVQAYHAPDRDVGVSYVMPTDQIITSNAVFTVVQPVMLIEHSTTVILPQAVNAKQTNQCLLTVIPHYKGPQLAVHVNNPLQYRQASFT